MENKYFQEEDPKDEKKLPLFNLMLSKKYRITKREFNFINRKAKSIFLDNINIKYFPNKNIHAQFAIVISKKIIKLATKRNKIRRIIKSWIAKDKKILGKSFYFVIYIKQSFNDKIKIEKNKQKLLNTLSKIY